MAGPALALSKFTSFRVTEEPIQAATRLLAEQDLSRAEPPLCLGRPSDDFIVDSPLRNNLALVVAQKRFQICTSRGVVRIAAGPGLFVHARA